MGICNKHQRPPLLQELYLKSCWQHSLRVFSETQKQLWSDAFPDITSEHARPVLGLRTLLSKAFKLVRFCILSIEGNFCCQ